MSDHRRRDDRDDDRREHGDDRARDVESHRRSDDRRDYRDDDRAERPRHARSRSRSPPRSRHSRSRSLSTSSRSSTSSRDSHRRHGRSKKLKSSGDKKDDKSRSKKSSKKHKHKHGHGTKKYKHAEDEERARAIREAEELAIIMDNPHEQNDATAFDWIKKRKKEEKMGLSRSERQKLEEQRRLESQQELAKLKQQREQRELEMAYMEEEKKRQRMEKELETLGNWEEKEETFHLDQAKQRAAIRIEEGRPHPIDLLVCTIDSPDDPKTFQRCRMMTREPFSLFRELSAPEMETLEKEIQQFISLEKEPNRLQFWQLMLVLCKDEQVKIQALKGGRNRAANKRGAHYEPRELYDFTSIALTSLDFMQPEVLREIHQLLFAKDHDQLVSLQQDVQRKLDAGGAIDVEYWETLLKALAVVRTRLKVRLIYQDAIRRRIAQHTAAQRGVEVEQLEDTLAKSTSKVGVDEIDDEQEEARGDEVAVAKPFAPGDDGIEEGAGPEEVLVTGAPVNADRMLQIELARELGPGEQVMSGDVSHAVEMHRPRLSGHVTHKPRYHNRMITGYEWTKYNRTHFLDQDNPPPKVVQGYKFNIFYPDLIDKTATPTYKIIPDPSAGPENETVLLRFSSGPPYEDVVFRIVNLPWDTQYKHGFRCSFDRATMQLWFRFKRQFYRR